MQNKIKNSPEVTTQITGSITAHFNINHVDDVSDSRVEKYNTTTYYCQINWKNITRLRQKIDKK